MKHAYLDVTCSTEEQMRRILTEVEGFFGTLPKVIMAGKIFPVTDHLAEEEIELLGARWHIKIITEKMHIMDLFLLLKGYDEDEEIISGGVGILHLPATFLQSYRGDTIPPC
jgi:hypothetical protein